MASFFYNRTTYRWLDRRLVPACFLWLDHEVFEKIGVGPAHAPHRPIVIAQAVCQRMADVNFFAAQIAKVFKGPDVGRASPLVSTYLVAYFAACKGLLDGVAIGLDQLFNLGLSAREQDFGKAKLLRTLAQRDKDIAKRYEIFGAFVSEIIAWRDAAVHRLSPTAALYYLRPGPPRGRFKPKDWEVRIYREKGASLATVATRDSMTRLDFWIKPTELLNKWRPTLLKVCETFCDDLGKSVLAGWH